MVAFILYNLYIDKGALVKYSSQVLFTRNAPSLFSHKCSVEDSLKWTDTDLSYLFTTVINFIVGYFYCIEHGLPLNFVLLMVIRKKEMEKISN